MVGVMVTVDDGLEVDAASILNLTTFPDLTLLFRIIFVAFALTDADLFSFLCSDFSEAGFPVPLSSAFVLVFSSDRVANVQTH